MFDDLFQKKPEYDENGQLVGYSQPKIVWIILALVVLYCFKDKLMKQTGGGEKSKNDTDTNLIIFIVLFLASWYYIGLFATIFLLLAIGIYIILDKLGLINKIYKESKGAGYLW